MRHLLPLQHQPLLQHPLQLLLQWLRLLPLPRLALLLLLPVPLLVLLQWLLVLLLLLPVL